MSGHITFSAPTTSDSEILRAFKKIADELDQHQGRCHVRVQVLQDHGSSPQFRLSLIENAEFAQHAKKFDAATWESVSIHFEPAKLNLTLTRNRELGDDEIRIRYREVPSEPYEIRRTIIAIQRQFVPLNRAAAIERALGPEIAEFYRLREETLTRLENLTNRIVRETHDYRLQLDTDTAKHKRKLTASLEEEYKKRTAVLRDRERELNELRQELDDRSARHARREQSRALQQKISHRSEKFTLTADTRRKRWPIHVIFGMLLSLSGVLIAHSLLSPADATAGVPLWMELGRLPLGMLGFALTAIFYIRWNDQWFRQHAEQEFRLQQLALDVDRASYATEMLLEWQEDKGGEIPAVMVDRLTAGLFTDQTEIKRVRHPSEDAVTALLKAASSVRVNVPGIGDVILTGRQIRKVDKNIVKNQSN